MVEIAPVVVVVVAALRGVEDVEIVRQPCAGRQTDFKLDTRSRLVRIGQPVADFKIVGGLGPGLARALRGLADEMDARPGRERLEGARRRREREPEIRSGWFGTCSTSVGDDVR